METGQPPGASGWSRGRVAGVAIGCLLAVGLVVLLVIGLVKRDDDLNIDRRIGEGKAVAAPAFTLPVLHAAGPVGPVDAPMRLSSLRGHPVVLNIWASWCGPCEQEAPILQRMWTDYRSKGVVVLGVDTQDLTDKAKAFIAEHDLTFPSVRDGSSKTQDSFGATGVPETFVIDPDGTMRFLPVRGELNRAAERDIRAHLDTLVGP